MGEEDAEVRSVAFSPDGMQIALGLSGHTIRLCIAGTGESIGKPLEGHTESVDCVAFSPNGKQIVSGSWDKTIRLWDARTGSSIGAPLEGHTARVISVAFSPDGMWIVSGSPDHMVRLWDVRTGKSTRVLLDGHTDSVSSFAFFSSPDAMQIASSSWDRTIRLWDTQVDSSNQAAQYPARLFPQHTFTIQDGWLLTADGDLILWLPPAYNSSLVHPGTTVNAIIGAQALELNFENFKCGTEWAQCRHSDLDSSST